MTEDARNTMTDQLQRSIVARTLESKQCFR